MHEPPVPANEAWRALPRHRDALSSISVRELFTADVTRFSRLSFEAAGLLLDLSKNRITQETLELLAALARQCDLETKIRALFAGEPLNTTEHRAAAHVALRDPRSCRVEGVDVSPIILRERERVRRLIAALHEQRWVGYDGQPIRDVVNIGIGGSDLGPRMVTQALRHEHTGHCRTHFVANVDGGEILSLLAQLQPATTLFIIASKSFTTPETTANALTAREWLSRAAGTRLPEREMIARHFIAISAAPERAVAFGIERENVFELWDWVGGRYSLWSSIGIPIACAIGMDGFERLLAGAATMDRHFRETEISRNLPVLMALLGIWHGNILGAESHAVVPYDERLALLPAYLQQLDMESNGKSVQHDGTPAAVATAPILWGGTGSNAQHAFFQLLHQGTRFVPVDFVVPLRHPVSPPRHHDALVANCLAQSEALMRGRTLDEALALAGVTRNDADATALRLARHRVMPGNRPHNLLVLEELTAETLGALLACYEHRTFVQGVIWNINSFDQWGVEMGKVLAAGILAEIGGADAQPRDGSTRGLLERYRALRRD